MLFSRAPDLCALTVTTVMRKGEQEVTGVMQPWRNTSQMQLLGITTLVYKN